MISFQPKVKRLIKKDYGTSFEMVLLRISVISVAYSSLQLFQLISTFQAPDSSLALLLS